MKLGNRVGFNVRKKQILRILDHNSLTAEEVAKKVGITDGAARHLLARYHLSGLLRKSELPKINLGRGRNPYFYTLSETGRRIFPRIRERIR